MSAFGCVRTALVLGVWGARGKRMIGRLGTLARDWLLGL